MTTSTSKELAPLTELLDSVLTRLSALETACGIQAAAPVKSKHHPAATPVATPSKLVHGTSGEAEAVKAYDKYVKESVVPLVTACDGLKDLSAMGKHIQEAWEGIRTLIVLASRSKQPPEAEYAAQLGAQLQSTTQPAIQAIASLQLDRKWEFHHKAVQEAMGALGWSLMRAPKQMPAPHVKETIGSSDFWSNRIRKEYKGKDELQIAFCDGLKKALTGLVEYIQDYHKTGLTFNPKGVSLAEAIVLLSDEAAPAEAPPKEQQKKRRGSALGPSVKGGASANLFSELNARQSSDGSSAATGLKHVTRDQQTWRKEYKKPSDTAAKKTEPPKSPTKKKETKKPLRGLPICEYQDRGQKWVLENQTKDSVAKEFADGILKVEANDPKHQVYLFNCEGVSVQVVGKKIKSVILDNCKHVNVQFETVISSCEIVNCKKVQLQTTGVCPIFSIDKSSGCTIWMSKETLEVTSFVASMSTEMNVNYPDGEDRKEVPIPEQFVHKLVNGAVTSEVSDLYH